MLYMHAHDYSLLYYYSYRMLCKSEAVRFVHMCTVKYYNPLIGTFPYEIITLQSIIATRASGPRMIEGILFFP